jgi:acyl-CoA dehydrogenase
MALDFELTEEQKMIVETVRKFKEKECPKEKVREWDKTETFPTHVWKRLGEIGLLGAAFPEQYGGTGGGIIEETLITEELSYGFSDLGLTYLLGVCFGGISILEQGNEEQKKKYLPPLIAGNTNFCLSLTEPGGGTDILGALKSRAKQDGDYFILNGTKIFTTGAHVADTIVGVFRTDDSPDKPARGLTIFLIDKKSPGITCNKIEKLGSHILSSFEVVYEDVKVHKSQILGERGKGWYQIIATLNNERIVCAAICLGLARAALDDAVQYAKEREAFGKPIGQYQAIQHPLAESATELEAARLITYKAAWMQSKDPQSTQTGVIATMAKYYASEIAQKATDRGMRVLAGYGFTEEYDMQRYFRNIRQLIFAPITNEMSKNFLGQVMLGLPKSY